jgi:hypothetical protein
VTDLQEQFFIEVQISVVAAGADLGIVLVAAGIDRGSI